MANPYMNDEYDDPGSGAEQGSQRPGVHLLLDSSINLPPDGDRLDPYQIHEDVQSFQANQRGSVCHC
jgi:hypothetical protein